MLNNSRSCDLMLMSHSPWLVQRKRSISGLKLVCSASSKSIHSLCHRPDSKIMGYLVVINRTSTMTFSSQSIVAYQLCPEVRCRLKLGLLKVTLLTPGSPCAVRVALNSADLAVLFSKKRLFLKGPTASWTLYHCTAHCGTRSDCMAYVSKSLKYTCCCLSWG